jgi:FkbM family methyltransferase
MLKELIMKFFKKLKNKIYWNLFSRKILKETKGRGQIIHPFTQKFKDFFLDGNFKEKLQILKSDLDDLSKRHVSVFIDRMMNFPSPHYHSSIIGFWDDILKIENLDYDRKEIDNFIKREAKSKFIFSSFAPEVFYFDHGLKFLDQKALDYLKGKDFLDCGAWKGDSALTFLKYQPRKIYSFEVYKKFVGEFEEVMKLNKVSKDKAEAFHFGTSDKARKISFSAIDSPGNNIHSGGDEEVEAITIDDFVDKYNINPSLIKIDVEGEEINTIIGARKTIEKFRPIITTAIYHEPHQFFELKPLLESWNLGYKFIIRALRSDVPPMEMTLIAIPEIE